MNFDFLRECRMESPKLQNIYEQMAGKLERAEECYWSDPRECGILLRSVAEQICRIYNHFYEIGFSDEMMLETFLCYSRDEGHNVMVSRFLSVVRKEQRDRLNKLRVLGDDCICGEAAPDLGMSFENRMSNRANRMMQTMMDVLKDMCAKVNRRGDLEGLSFSEEMLPGAMAGMEKGAEKTVFKKPGALAHRKKRGLLAGIFGRRI